MEELVDTSFVRFVELVEAAFVGRPAYHIGHCVVPLFPLDHVFPEVLVEIRVSNHCCFVACDRMTCDV